MTGADTLAMLDAHGWWPEESETFLDELRAEVPLWGHPLSRRLRGARVIARALGSDDILVALRRPAGAHALVHLTWTGKTERRGFPATAEYPSLEAALGAIGAHFDPVDQ